MPLTLNNWTRGSSFLNRFAFGIAPNIWHIKRPRFGTYDLHFMYTVQNGEWVRKPYIPEFCIDNKDFMFQYIKEFVEEPIQKQCIKLSVLKQLKIKL